jgi:hypothetical protein
LNDKHRLALPILALFLLLLVPFQSFYSQIIGIVAYIVSDANFEELSFMNYWWRVQDGDSMPATVQQSRYRPPSLPIGYPRVYMILSCIMWSMAFVATYTGISWGGAMSPPKELVSVKRF